MERTSISDRHEPYVAGVTAACADAAAFATFKQLPGIKEVIERVKPTRGAEYRAIVLSQTPGLLQYLDKFKENDAVGAPDMSTYPEGPMSPTTWRYIKVLSDLQVLFGSLDGWHIAEIGAGYGGQCKIISDVYDVASYTIYDLEPVARLARKYLGAVGSPAADKLRLADFRQLGLDAPVTFDLVISNWALSECAKDMQDCYIEHVLRQSTHGYLTYNQIAELCGMTTYRLNELIDALTFPIEVADEQPGGDAVPDAWQFLRASLLHWGPRAPHSTRPPDGSRS